MDTPKAFCFQSKQVRTTTENGVIWFVASDVCAALGISWNGATLKPIPESWSNMLNHNIFKTNKPVRAISEPAVYKLAFRSNKPEADAFTNWVASEVLPAIRKTGKFEAKAEKPKQLALTAPEPSNAILANTPKWYKRQIEHIYHDYNDRVYEFKKFMRAIHNELGRVTGPMYKDVLHKLTGSKTMFLDLPISNFHDYRYRAMSGTEESIELMYDAITLARKYARMLDG